MKRLAGSLSVTLLALVFALAIHTNGVFAGDNDPAVIHLQVVKTDSLPIPVGEIVRFKTIGSVLAVVWYEKVDYGVIEHRYAFDGIQMTIGIYQPDTTIQDFRSPQDGDLGTLDYYRGNWEGIVKAISFKSIRVFTDREWDLIAAINEFHQEAMHRNFFFMTYYDDCPSGRFFLDSKPLAAGPYGNTYMVPPEGGLLTSVFPVFPEGHWCHHLSGITDWTTRVKPGDYVEGFNGSAYVEPLNKMDPWVFYNLWNDVRPAWQPKTAPGWLNQWYSKIQTRDNPSIRATLARMGFRYASKEYGGDWNPTGWTPFGWVGSKPNLVMPGYWTNVPSVALSDTVVYTTAIGTDPYLITLRYAGQDTAIKKEDMTFGWGAPIIFIPNQLLDGDRPFDWKDYRIFRLLSGKNGAIIQERVIEGQKKIIGMPHIPPITRAQADEIKKVLGSQDIRIGMGTISGTEQIDGMDTIVVNTLPSAPAMSEECSPTCYLAYPLSSKPADGTIVLFMGFVVNEGGLGKTVIALLEVYDDPAAISKSLQNLRFAINGSRVWYWYEVHY